MLDTERAVYVQKLDPDEREAYIEASEAVPSGVTDAMARRGVEEFELYVRSDIAVCILECPAVNAYRDAVGGDEAVGEWERYTSRFKRSGVGADPEEGIPFMSLVWRFEPSAE